jgi:hypothetical protein
MKSKGWSCNQFALYAGRQPRIIISAALYELKNRFCSGVLFEFSLYTLDGIKPGMK